MLEMRRSKRLPLLSLVAVIAVGLIHPADTSGQSNPVGLGLGANFFPILPWDAQHGWKEPFVDRKQGLASIAECNFTVAGFVQPRDLPLCEKLGLKAFIAPPPDGPPWARPWRTLTDDEIGTHIRKMIDHAGDSPAILGYFLMDEPGTPFFPALSKAVAAIKKHAPGKLAYINLLPGYATLGAPDRSQLGASSFTEYLERFVTEVKPQFISYDNYMVQYSDDLRSPPRTASYFNDLLTVRRVALQHGLPFWNIVSSNQIRPWTPIPSPSNLMLQAYTTLAAGGRGVSWYTFYSGVRGPGYGYAPIDGDGNRTESFQYLQWVNRQIRTVGPMMNRLKSIGVCFSNPLLVEGLPTLPGKLVKGVEARASIKPPSETRPPVMVGEFASQDGGDYVMLVNLSLQQSAHILVQTQKEYKDKRVFSAVDGRWIPLDEAKGHWLVAGQGVLLKLE